MTVAEQLIYCYLQWTIWNLSNDNIMFTPSLPPFQPSNQQIINNLSSEDN